MGRMGGSAPGLPSSLKCDRPAGRAVYAPQLLDIEGVRGQAALSDLGDLPIHRMPHVFLLPRVWALRENLTAYDAVYVALAEALDAVLLTRDRRLAGAAGHRARIVLV